MLRFREPVNGFTHLAGAVLALIGTIWLVALTLDDLPRMVVMLVYGVSMVLLYAASATMHLYNGDTRTIQFLNRLDHAAIYLLIAGTYTPFIYHFLDGEWRWALLALIWGMAVTGMLFKLVFFWGGHVSTILYVAMGWVAVFFAPVFLPLLSVGALLLLLAGGLVYTGGAIIFALHRPNLHRYFGHHELWHVCVMVASGIHFAAVLLFTAA